MAADAGVSAYHAFGKSQIALGAGETGLSALKVGEIGVEGSNAAFEAIVNAMILSKEVTSKLIQTGIKL